MMQVGCEYHMIYKAIIAVNVVNTAIIIDLCALGSTCSASVLCFSIDEFDCEFS